LNDYNPTLKHIDKGEIVLSNSRIVFRNFTGEERKFNEAGKRNFAVVLTPELADELEKDDWNVKRKPPKEEGDDEFCFLSVTVSYKGKPPRIILITESMNRRTTLDEDTADMVDVAEIETIDMILRPYDWEVNGNCGRKAYLKSIYVTLHEDELDIKYAGYREAEGFTGEPDVEEFED